MKTLLPILKTKLVLLSFVSACTVILATTVPQIRNLIVAEKSIGEKIITEQKKISPKIKKQNKEVNVSRVTSGLSFEMNNSFVATVQTDKPDYIPGDTVTITGSGWQPGETVTLTFEEIPVPTTCMLPHDLTVVADASGNIYSRQFPIKPNHIGVTFILTATGLSSNLTAETIFTDALITSAQSGNWNNINTWTEVSRPGTVAYTSGFAEVIGTGTSFMTDVVVGAIITTPNPGGITGTVASIVDDTHLFLTATVSETRTGKSYTAKTIPNPGDQVTIAGDHTVTVNIVNAACSTLTANTSTNNKNSCIEICIWLDSFSFIKFSDRNK